MARKPPHPQQLPDRVTERNQRSPESEEAYRFMVDPRKTFFLSLLGRASEVVVTLEEPGFT